MNEATLEKHLDFTGGCMDNDNFRRIRGIEGLFSAEEQFLQHLFKLEKECAEQAIRIVINNVIDVSSDAGVLQDLKYYFITLTGIIARQMRQLHVSAEKAFYFNSTCIGLIEDKLTKHNVAEIVDELVAYFIYSVQGRTSPTLPHQTVNDVIQYIDEKIQSPLSVEGLATIFGVSTSHLSRIFREHLGITLVEYINIKKVEESQYYLRFSDKKISDISNDFHFCNQSYYTRIFKKYTGYTPRKFRENITGSYFKFAFPEEKQVAGKE